MHCQECGRLVETRPRIILRFAPESFLGGWDAVPPDPTSHGNLEQVMRAHRAARHAHGWQNGTHGQPREHGGGGNSSQQTKDTAPYRPGIGRVVVTRALGSGGKGWFRQQGHSAGQRHSRTNDRTREPRHPSTRNEVQACRSPHEEHGCRAPQAMRMKITAVSNLRRRKSTVGRWHGTMHDAT